MDIHLKRPFLFSLVGLLSFVIVAIAAEIHRWIPRDVRAALSTVQRDWDSLTKAFFAYGVDRCGVYFPEDTSQLYRKDPTVPLTFATHERLYIPESHPRKPGELPQGWQPLTTPIAYAISLPLDPFTRRLYGYTCWNIHDEKPTVAVLHSPGPDGEDDLPLATLRTEMDAYLAQRSGSMMLEPEDCGAIMSIAQPFCYDPTNGLVSRGDLIWIADGYVNTWSPWKKQGPWASAVTPGLPILEVRRPLPEDWTAGQPLPNPVSVPEQIRRKQYRQVPMQFEQLLGMNELGPRNADGRYDLVLERLEPLQNRFGRDFADFFKVPHPLTPDEKQKLARWEAELPRWWQILESSGTLTLVNSSCHMKEADLYVLLPYWGKSQLLLAARDAGDGTSEAALARLQRLKGLLSDLKEMARQPDAYEERVHRELMRLAEALAGAISGS